MFTKKLLKHSTAVDDLNHRSDAALTIVTKLEYWNVFTILLEEGAMFFQTTLGWDASLHVIVQDHSDVVQQALERAKAWAGKKLMFLKNS